MTRRVILSDPGDEVQHLFAPESTLPPKCSCGCTAKNLCPIDAANKHGGPHKWAARPRACLTRIDPAEGVIPY